MYGMMKRYEIQVLLRAGLVQAEVAKIAGVSERTVRSVQAEPMVVDVDDEVERRKRRIGRPSKAEPFRKFVLGLLDKEPGLMSLEILRRARLQGYTGGKTALYDLIAAVRPSVVRPIVRFEGLPGEFTQHDFGQVDVRFPALGLPGAGRRVSRAPARAWANPPVMPTSPRDLTHPALGSVRDGCTWPDGYLSSIRNIMFQLDDL
jgi:hypothetical protein